MKTNFDTARGTGRTTRALTEVIRQAREGRQVIFVMPNHYFYSHILRLVDELVNDKEILKWNKPRMILTIGQGAVHLETRDSMQNAPDKYRGIRPEPLIIYDHAA